MNLHRQDSLVLVKLALADDRKGDRCLIWTDMFKWTLVRTDELFHKDEKLLFRNFLYINRGGETTWESWDTSQLKIFVNHSVLVYLLSF